MPISMKTTKMWRLFALAMAMGLPGAVPTLRATLIAQQTEIPTGNIGNNNAPFGQSVTTPAGGPWNSIQFNFYDINLAPAASGTLFVLSQEYTGAPAALSNATAGFLASSATISGGAWQFNALTLQPNTQYFFLMNSTALPFWVFSTLDNFAGGSMYTANAAAYFSIPGQDTSFRLQGEVVADGGAVPEPATFAVVGGVILAMLCGARTTARDIRSRQESNR